MLLLMNMIIEEREKKYDERPRHKGKMIGFETEVTLNGITYILTNFLVSAIMKMTRLLLR